MEDDARSALAEAAAWRAFCASHALLPLPPGYAPSKVEPSESYCLRLLESRVRIPPAVLAKVSASPKGMSGACLRFPSSFPLGVAALLHPIPACVRISLALRGWRGRGSPPSLTSLSVGEFKFPDRRPALPPLPLSCCLRRVVVRVALQFVLDCTCMAVYCPLCLTSYAVPLKPGWCRWPWFVCEGTWRLCTVIRVLLCVSVF